ncbi:unnamed protein product [Aphanomyces euteiches]
MGYNVRSRAVVFGGRADDTETPHVPRTYDIMDVHGKLEFATYTDLPVKDTCTDDTCAVPIGVYFNDVWAYDISKPEFYRHIHKVAT